MFENLERLSTPELRALLLHESRKFVFALELGCPIGELEIIRSRIRHATELLENREKVELKPNDTTAIASPTEMEGLGHEPVQTS